MKRCLSLVLAALMLLSLTYCAAFAQGEKDYSEKMTITWASIQVNEAVDYNADEFSKQWQEQFNIEWEMIPLTWDNWAEKLRIWINSSDMPDISTWNYVHGEYSTYVDQGLIRELPEGWREKWPDLAAAYSASELGPALTELFGAEHCLPKPRFYLNKPAEVLPNHMGAFMRKDWMEAVGVEIKDAYTVNELLDIARKIKEEDPGQVGERLAPIEVRTGNMGILLNQAMYAHSSGDSVFYVGEDGTYKWGPADPQTLEGLKIYQQAYREGLLHPEFYTLKQNEDLEDYYVTGTAAITCEGGLSYYSTLYGKAMEQNLGLDPEKAMHFACITDNEGRYQNSATVNFWTCNIFSPEMEDEKFERIMDILDYSCTEEGQLRLRLGIEGIDWKREDDGTLVNLIEGGNTVSDKYDSIMPLYINMQILSDDFDMMNPAYPEFYRDTTRRQYELRTAISDETTLIPTDWVAYFQDSPSRNKVAFDYPTEYAQLVVKEGDLEENWNTWVEEKMQLIQPVLDELNALIA